MRRRESGTHRHFSYNTLPVEDPDVRTFSATEQSDAIGAHATQPPYTPSSSRFHYPSAHDVRPLSPTVQFS